MWPPKLNIIDVIRSPQLINDQDISRAQLAALKAGYGLNLDGEEELELYCRATEKKSYVPAERRELVYVVGRRGGKDSKLAASIAVYEAIFRTHRLTTGERGYVLILAATQSQAKICFNYVLGKLQSSPLLSGMILGEPRNDEIDLVNGITIAVMPANFRTVRGRSAVCVICSEIAFWLDSETGSNPAKEILRALRPSMATFPNAKLVMVSSPYAKQGVLWDAYQKRHSIDWGKKRLVWKLDSLTMNPALDHEMLREEEESDPENYAREYLAEFWESASNFLSADAIESCIARGRFELLPTPEVRHVFALDAAFRGDNFGFSGVLRVEDRVVQVYQRCWRGSRSRPVQLAEVLTEIVATLKRYGVGKIYGDQFCAEPIRQALKAQGIEFVQAATLGARAATIWNTLRTLITSRKIELLDDAATVAELKQLQMIVTSSGNQRIEAQTGHDDRCVALALAAHQAIAQPRRTFHPPYVFEVRCGSSLSGRAYPPPPPEFVDTHKNVDLNDPFAGDDRFWHKV